MSSIQWIQWSVELNVRLNIASRTPCIVIAERDRLFGLTGSSRPALKAPDRQSYGSTGHPTASTGHPRAFHAPSVPFVDWSSLCIMPPFLEPLAKICYYSNPFLATNANGRHCDAKCLNIIESILSEWYSVDSIQWILPTVQYQSNGISWMATSGDKLISQLRSLGSLSEKAPFGKSVSSVKNLHRESSQRSPIKVC